MTDDDRATIFAVTTCFFAAAALAFLGAAGLTPNYSVLLATSALIVPALLPLFNERPKATTVASSVVIALVIVLLLNVANTNLAFSALGLLFSLVLILPIPLMELRDKLFKSDKHVRS